VSTPTDEQQIRATLRRAERNHGTEAAAVMAVAETVGVLGTPPHFMACTSATA
jgi:hypothetical protein